MRVLEEGGKFREELREGVIAAALGHVDVVFG